MTDTKPTLEEQILQAQRNVKSAAFYESNLDVEKAILASLKELQSIKSQPVPVEPVAWVVQADKDGSIGSKIAPVNYAMFKDNLAKLHEEPWVKNGAAKVVPLYSQSAIDSLQSALQVAQMDAEGWRSPEQVKEAVRNSWGTNGGCLQPKERK